MQEARQYTGPPYSPELHLLDSEWYFTTESSQLLSGMVAQGRSCLLGAPTVADQMPGGNFVLVDRSPYLVARFPSLPANRLQRVNVEDWRGEPGYDFVILDPPWYYPQLDRWLDIALRSVAVGGKVIFPLLGEGTRPTAEHERARVLDFLGSAGHVELLADAVEYDVPLFESRALSAAGVTISGPWRRADLALVSVSSPPKDHPQLVTDASIGRVDSARWESFLIGTQVVKVRSSSSQIACGEPLLQTVDGVDGFTLDTVSRRDARIGQVDIWSSRNRVARVRDVPRVLQALRTAGGSGTNKTSRIAGELLNQGFDRASINEMFNYLELTDGH